VNSQRPSWSNFKTADDNDNDDNDDDDDDGDGGCGGAASHIPPPQSVITPQHTLAKLLLISRPRCK